MNLNNVIPTESFYFLRHGESVNNRDNLVNGWTDCPLTDIGRAHAREAALILKNYPINRIVTSDLQRAVETAEIIAQQLNLPIEKYFELRERNWGIYENGPRSERPGLEQTPEEGEGPEEYFGRVVQAIRKIFIGENTLIVGHAGTMRVIMGILGFESLDQRIPNTTPIVIGVKGFKLIK